MQSIEEWPTNWERIPGDPYFAIEKVKDGVGTPVIFTSGFGSRRKPQKHGKIWPGWKRLIDYRYPDNPIWRIYWNTQHASLKHYAVTVPEAKRAKSHAEMAGHGLAKMIEQTDDGETYILVGYSLGGRVMLEATLALANSARQEPRIETVHLLGAAYRQMAGIEKARRAVRGHIWNYTSDKDWVLRYICSSYYRLSRVAGSYNVIGREGFPFKDTKLRNVDVTEIVGANHFSYIWRVKLKRVP